MMTVLEQLEAGELNIDQAVHALCKQLATIQDKAEALKKADTKVRNQLSELVNHLGGKLVIPEFGTLEITAPIQVTTYKREKVEAALLILAPKFPMIAQILAGCKEVTERAGSLRVTRNKF